MAEEKHIAVKNLSVQAVVSPLVEDPLMLKDTWYAEKDLGMRFNRHHCHQALYFSGIIQDWFKHKVKLYILYCRNQGKAFRSLTYSVSVLRVFAVFLNNQCIYKFDAINDEVFSKFSNSIRHLAKGTQKNYMVCLKLFFEVGTLNG